MKGTGIVRNVDELGRIVIPKELRKTFNIDTGTPMEIFTEGDKIILRPYQNRCKVCGGLDRIEEIIGKPVCKTCIEQIKKL